MPSEDELARAGVGYYSIVTDSSEEREPYRLLLSTSSIEFNSSVTHENPHSPRTSTPTDHGPNLNNLTEGKILVKVGFNLTFFLGCVFLISQPCFALQTGSMSNEGPSLDDPPLSMSSTTDSLPPNDFLNEADSFLTASATTEFDSGRTNDSGASVSRTLEGYTNELDNHVPHSQKPLHGEQCVCLKCIKILNVDGNESPSDLSSSSESDVCQQSQASAQALNQPQAATSQNNKEQDVVVRNKSRRVNNPSRDDGLPMEPLPGPSRVTCWSDIPSPKRKNPPFPEKAKSRHPNLDEVIGCGSPKSSNQGDSEGEDDVDQFLKSVQSNTNNNAPEGEAQAKARDGEVCDFLDVSVDIDDLSDMTESEDELFENRVRTGWASDSVTNTTCDSTDYSDDDDLRNFFVDGGRTERDRAKTDAIIGREQRPEYDDLSIALDDESFEEHSNSDSSLSVSISLMLSLH